MFFFYIGEEDQRYIVPVSVVSSALGPMKHLETIPKQTSLCQKMAALIVERHCRECPGKGMSGQGKKEEKSHKIKFLKHICVYYLY